MGRAYKTVLALDTAMNGCSACVYDDRTGESFVRTEVMPRGQAVHLMPMVEDVMRESGREYKDLDAVITTRGPGAFTGLRIGLSTARALALALDIPVCGITTLQILALQTARREQIKKDTAIIIETKRSDFYFQIFTEDSAPISEPKALEAQDILEDLPPGCLIAGDAVARFKESIGQAGQAYQWTDKIDLPDPALMAEIFIETDGECAMITPDPSPLYIRPPDVTLPRAGRAAKKKS